MFGHEKVLKILRVTYNFKHVTRSLKLCEPPKNLPLTPNSSVFTTLEVRRVKVEIEGWQVILETRGENIPESMIHLT